MKMIYQLWICLILFAVFACNPAQKKESIENHSKAESFGPVKVEYAVGFDVRYSEGYKIIELPNPWQGSRSPLTYVLRNAETPKIDSISDLGNEIIIPLESIICNSTSHLSLLEVLGLETKLKGFAQTKYVYSPKINQLIDSGEVVEVGIEAQMNVEQILDISPDAVMAFSTGQENKQLNKLNELGLDVIMNADYMESTLLGRAEWLKFVALFFDKEVEANLYFDGLANRYDALINIVKMEKYPRVFSGTVYGSTWFMPAGQNYNAILIKDAGGKYLWSDDNGTGWLNIDFEAVYEKASEAEYWIGASDFKSLEVLKSVDSRYADFNAFKLNQVYTYTNKINSKGANDYFESGNVNPDKILADHIKILHPELLPNYDLYYYKQLYE